MMFSLLLVVGATVQAAKVNVFKNAAEAIKNRSKLAESRNALVAFATDSTVTVKDRAKAYFTAARVCQTINKVENEKLYLKQQYDTVQFFSSIADMYRYVLLCDSLEQTMPNGQKGKFAYRKEGAVMLQSSRTNLLNGAIWHMKGGRYKEALDVFNLYTGTQVNSVCNFGNDSQSHKIAYWAVQCSKATDNHRCTLEYVDSAMTLGVNLDYLYKYKAEAQGALGDTAGWVVSMEQGMRSFSSDTYFFVHLVDYMRAHHNYDQAMRYADEMVQCQPDTTVYRYTRCLVFLDTERWEECIEAADDVLKRDSSYADTYYNKGLCYVKRAIAFAPKVCVDLNDPRCVSDRKLLKDYYVEARKAMEHYRSMRPEDKERWAPSLYHIYLNLNMGKEFSEMERLLKN